MSTGSLLDNQRDTAVVIDAFIKLCESRRALLLPPGDGGMSRIAVLHDFCTVQLDPGRRSGKTTYIRQNLRTFDMVVVAPQLARSCYRDWPRRAFISNGLGNGLVEFGPGGERALYLAAQAFRDAPAGVPPRVYVDEPGLLAERLPLLYAVLAGAHGMSPTIVLLGASRMPALPDLERRLRGRE